MGAEFTILSITWSIFDEFSKFFFYLKACENCQFVKKWMPICVPCTPDSACPELMIPPQYQCPRPWFRTNNIPEVDSGLPFKIFNLSMHCMIYGCPWKFYPGKLKIIRVKWKITLVKWTIPREFFWGRFQSLCRYVLFENIDAW